jgi:hypothetical protein
MATSPPGSLRWIESSSKNAWAWKQTFLTSGLCFACRFLEMRCIGKPSFGLILGFDFSRAERLVAPASVRRLHVNHVQQLWTRLRENRFVAEEKWFQPCFFGSRDETVVRLAMLRQRVHKGASLTNSSKDAPSVSEAAARASA